MSFCEYRDRRHCSQIELYGGIHNPVECALSLYAPCCSAMVEKYVGDRNLVNFEHMIRVFAGITFLGQKGWNAVNLCLSTGVMYQDTVDLFGQDGVDNVAKHEVALKGKGFTVDSIARGRRLSVVDPCLPLALAKEIGDAVVVLNKTRIRLAGYPQRGMVGYFEPDHDPLDDVDLLRSGLTSIKVGLEKTKHEIELMRLLYISQLMRCTARGVRRKAFEDILFAVSCDVETCEHYYCVDREDRVVYVPIDNSLARKLQRLAGRVIGLE